MEDYFIFEEDKKKNKKSTDKHRVKALIFSFMIVLIAASLLISNIVFFPHNKNINYKNAGNNYGNISSGGYAVGGDSFVYFSNANDGYCIWKQSTSSGDITKLNTSQSWNLSYYDGWIFYSNYDDDYSIYKIRVDGTENTKLNDTKSLYINVCDGWIYFTDSSNGGYICKMDIQGKNVSTLNKEKSVYLCLYDNWIYYSNSSNYSYLYRIKTDGTEQTLVCKRDARNLNILDEYIYFTSYEDESKMFSNVYRISFDSDTPKKLSDEYCEKIVVYNNHIYYVAADGGHIGKLSVNGKSSEIIFELPEDMIEIKYINICNDKLYYCASDNSDVNFSYVVDIDGTNSKILK